MIYRLIGVFDVIFSEDATHTRGRAAFREFRGETTGCAASSNLRYDPLDHHKAPGILSSVRIPGLRALTSDIPNLRMDMPFQTIIVVIADAILLVAGLLLVADSFRRLIYRRRRSDHVLHT